MATTSDLQKTEVSGVNQTLEDAITAEIVPQPKLMGFNDFQRWRSGVGKRPTTASDGFYPPTQVESILWRRTMERIYGSTWAEYLADQDAEASGAAAASSGAAGDSTPAGTARSGVNTPGSDEKLR